MNPEGIISSSTIQSLIQKCPCGKFESYSVAFEDENGVQKSVCQKCYYECIFDMAKELEQARVAAAEKEAAE